MTLFPSSKHHKSYDSSPARAPREDVSPGAMPGWETESIQPRIYSPSFRSPPSHHDVVLGEGATANNVQVLEDLWHTATIIQQTPPLRLQKEILTRVSELATRFESQLCAYTPFQAITGATSLANIGYRDLSLFNSLHNHIKGRGLEISVPTLADLAWSCGKLAIQDGALLDTIKKMALSKQRLARMHDRENPRSVISFKERALITWGAAVACSEDKRQDFVKQFVHPQDLEGSSVPLNYWHMMYQSLVIAGILDGSEQFDQLQQLEERRDGNEERLINKFEMAVLHAALNLVGEDRCTYHIHERIAGVEADLLIRAPEGMVVIESDGEAFHRLIGPDGGVLQGKDQGQDIFFRKLGVKAVIHVGSQEWDPLWGEDILREKIQTHAPFLFNRP